MEDNSVKKNNLDNKSGSGGNTDKNSINTAANNNYSPYSKKDNITRHKVDFLDSIIRIRGSKHLLSAAKAQIEHQDVELTDLRNDNESLAEKLEYATNRVRDLEEKLKQNRQEKDGLQAVLNISEQTLSNNRNELSETNQKLYEALERIQELEDQLKQSNKAYANLNSVLTKSEQTIALRLNEIDQTNDKLRKANDKIYELTEKLNQSQSENESLKSFIKDSEQTIANNLSNLEETNEKLRKSSGEVALLEKQIATLNKILEETNNQNNKLRDQIVISEINETELKNTIAHAQQEKDFVQYHLDKLLLRIAKNFPYNPPHNLNDLSSMAPEAFITCIPFCFPERIPTLVKMHNEVMRSIRGSLSKVYNYTFFPKLFKTNKQTVKTALHNPARNILMIFPKTDKWHILRFGKVKRVSAEEIYLFTRINIAQKFSLTFASKINKDKAFKANVALRQKQELPMPLVFCMPASPQFRVKNYSLELYINFLCKTLIHDGTLPSQQNREKITMSPIEPQNDIFETKKIYFQEKLAFSDIKPIKFSSKTSQRIEIKFDFMQENKLRNVLRTFGKTLDSMVKQFENNKTKSNKVKK